MKLLQYLTEGLEAHFAWRVRQRKRWDRNPLLVTFQDKYAAKLYAAAHQVKSAEILYVTDDPVTLPFAQLPPDYFIKATHGQNWNIRSSQAQLRLYRNGADLLDKTVDKRKIADSFLSEQACVAKCDEWLRRLYSTSEWAYTEIKPRIIVEEALSPRMGDELYDYRFYTFAGRVKAISVGCPSYRNAKQNVFFTPTWNPIPLTHYAEALPDPLPKKPDSLSEMLATAETLGQDIDFVRVDLYDTNQGIRLGELTMYPEAGRVGTPTGCRNFNRWLGLQWAKSPRRQRVECRSPIFHEV